MQWDSPSVSAAILGTEVKGEISVAEQKHVWVGGKRQVWLRLADKTFTAGGGHSTGTGSTFIFANNIETSGMEESQIIHGKSKQ